MPYADPEAKKLNRRKYRAANVERHREWQRKYDAKPEIRADKAEYHRRYYSDPQNRIRSLRICAIHRARKQGLECDADFLASLVADPPQSCECCGEEIEYVNRKKFGRLRSPSLDRLDNEKGYVQGNVKIICQKCNGNKRDMSVAELQRIITYMTTNGVTRGAA